MYLLCLILLAGLACLCLRIYWGERALERADRDLRDAERRLGLAIDANWHLFLRCCGLEAEAARLRREAGEQDPADWWHGGGEVTHG